MTLANKCRTAKCPLYVYMCVCVLGVLAAATGNWKLVTRNPELSVPLCRWNPLSCLICYQSASALGFIKAHGDQTTLSWPSQTRLSLSSCTLLGELRYHADTQLYPQPTSPQLRRISITKRRNASCLLAHFRCASKGRTSTGAGWNGQTNRTQSPSHIDRILNINL